MRDPVFIVGTERSGSNLLRVMLDAHSGLCVPHPPHLLKYFGDLEGSYPSLDPLVDDVLRLLQTHIHPWELSIDREALLRAEPPDLVGVMVALYTQAAQAAGKTRWGCKSTFVIDHAERVAVALPQARFIHLVRDVRDVAASSLSSVFNPSHPVHAAELWRRQQERGLRIAAERPEAWLRVRYEELVGQPQATLERVCVFLGMDFEPGMLDYHRSSEAERGARLSASWKNTASPPQKSRAGRYRQTLSPELIAAVEEAAGPVMWELGYEPEMTGRRPPFAARTRYELSAARQRVGIELKSLREDANHWRRWRRDATVALIRLRRRAP